MSPDNFVLEREYGGEASWFVRLSNGEDVFQDDGRPGLTPRSAWMRLKERLETEPLRIESVGLRFRTNVLQDVLPRYAEGYAFMRAALSTFGSAETSHFYVLGCLKGSTLHVRRFAVPELLLATEEERDPASVGESLIPNGP